MPKGGNGGNGGGGNGVIKGNKRDNLLTGTPGDDLIQGLDGNDTLEGLDGADTLEGGNGDDRLDGGIGDDLLSGGDGNDVAFGGDGADTVEGGLGADSLWGGAGDDSISGGAGSDQLSGGGGNDQIDGGTGDDTLIFDGNRDDYTVTQIDAVTVLISGPEGSATVTGVEIFAFADMTQSFGEVIIPRDPNVSAGAVTPETVSVLEGASVQFDWTVGSDGVIDAGDSTTQLVIATAPDAGSIIEIFGVQQTGALATGTIGSYAGALDTTGLAPGTYYVAAMADAGGVLAESDEGDNISDWVAFTIDPLVFDYRLDSVEVLPDSDFSLNPDPYSGDPGARIDVAWTVSNSGNTGPTSFVIQTFFSRDAVLSADDIEVGTEYTSAAPGETVQEIRPIELTENFPNGDWYIISVISPDYYYDGPSDDPGDNIAVTATPVTLTGGWSYGTDGDDIFQGQFDYAVYEGYAGNDTLLAVTTQDYFRGGEGTDTVDYTGFETGVGVFNEDYGYGPQLFVEVYDPYGYPDPYTQRGLLEDVERVIGTDYDDAFYITTGAVTFVDAGAGDDVILGSFGDDEIIGGAGRDQIAGIFGDDILTGGAGPDEFYFDRDDDGAGGTTGHGHDVITDFDPFEDLLFIEYQPWVETLDPLSLVQSVEGGLLVEVADDSSVFLAGLVDGDLNASNMFAVEEGSGSVMSYYL